ncbi:hypothetical protein AAVH_15748 [Aphelenchoides avenae]|nr:hypothetical protein AAVH_15748 [Aphelenchus avenae]
MGSTPASAADPTTTTTRWHRIQPRNCWQLNSAAEYVQANYICPACRPAPVPLRDIPLPAPGPLRDTPVPAPANTAETPNTPRDFAVLQLNVNGLKNKAKELEALLTERNILVAVLQETKLGPKQKTPKFSNYTIVRKDRTTHGGGLAILVHHRLVFTERALVEVPGDAHLEQMAVDLL